MDIYIKGKNNQSKVYFHDNGILLHRRHSRHSDNQCEWLAVIDALEFIKKNITTNGVIFNIFMDSILIFNQIVGDYRVKSPSLKPLKLKWNKLKNELINHFGATFKYIKLKKTMNIARKCLIDED